MNPSSFMEVMIMMILKMGGSLSVSFSSTFVFSGIRFLKVVVSVLRADCEQWGLQQRRAPGGGELGGE